MRYNKFYDYIKDYNKNYNPKLPYIYVSNTVVPCRPCDPGLTANVLCTSPNSIFISCTYIMVFFHTLHGIGPPTHHVGPIALSPLNTVKTNYNVIVNFII